MDITVSISNQTFQQIKKKVGRKLNRKEERQIKADIKAVLEGFYGRSVVEDAIRSYTSKRARIKHANRNKK